MPLSRPRSPVCRGLTAEALGPDVQGTLRQLTQVSCGGWRKTVSVGGGGWQDPCILRKETVGGTVASRGQQRPKVLLPFQALGPGSLKPEPQDAAFKKKYITYVTHMLLLLLLSRFSRVRLCATP